jgi:pimeloyl-ACP methyl ester carboxylesterase
MMTSLRGLLTSLVVLVCLAGSRAAADEFVSNGVKIHYSVKGKGEPVILIHGWLASGWLNWDLPGTTDLLAKNYQVIWLDLPGHGRSDHPRNEDAYGLEMVEDVVRLMDHLKIKKAHLVGYSMGGMTTAKFLVKYPDRALSGLLGGMGWLREGSDEQKLFSIGGKAGVPVGICFKSMAKLALTEKELKSIKTPVMVLFGDKDALRKGYLDPLMEVRKDWPVVDIADADHITCVLRQQFREEIRKWIDKNAQK